MKRRVISLVVTMVMAVSILLTGCSSKDTKTGTDSAATKESASSGEQAGDSAKNITLKVFSNLPDRKNGQGLVEQKIIEDYMAENPGVKIEVEALDEEAYKTKFKAYAMDGMPDVVSIWGQPSFLSEVLEAGVLAE